MGVHVAYVASTEQQEIKKRMILSLLIRQQQQLMHSLQSLNTTTNHNNKIRMITCTIPTILAREIIQTLGMGMCNNRLINLLQHIRGHLGFIIMPNRPLQFQQSKQVPISKILNAETIQKFALQQQQQMTHSYQLQQKTDASIQNLKRQVGQLASTVSQLQAQGSSQLPTQTILNLKGNAITLSGGHL